MFEKIILLGCLLIGGTNLGNHNNEIQSCAVTWEYSNEIEDGAIYFIRSALLDSQVLDVPNSDYSNGKDLILYHSLGWNNQRFVINKEGTYGDNTTYTINPLDSFSYNLSIEGENADDGKTLELKNSSTFGSNIYSHKFIFIPGATKNSFKISTGSSDFNKYLTLNNYSVADNTKIVQSNYDSSYAKCYDWYLQKTDSLGVNTKNEAYINGTNEYHFNVRVPVSGEYIFETSQYDNNVVDTVLKLYKDDGTLLMLDDDSGDAHYSKLTYNLDSNNYYWLKLCGYNSFQIGSVNLSLKSLNTVYINTYHVNDDIDTRADGISPQEDFVNAGYYARHIINATKNDVLCIDGNGYSRLNNKYYMLSSHGSSSGAALLSSGQYLYGSNLPDMSNSILSVWAICYGGKEGNIAEYAAKHRNAQKTLGFPGLTYVNTSKTFTDKLWEEITAGKSVNEAIDSALSHTRSTHWFTHIFGWGDDTIISPKLYSNIMTSNILVNNVNYNIKSYITSSSLSLTNFESLTSFQKNNNTKTFNFDDATIIMKFKNEMPTNKYFIIDKANNVMMHDTIINVNVQQKNKKICNKFELKPNQRIILQNEFCLVMDGIERNIKRIQYATTNDEFEFLDEIYIDTNTNEQFTEDQILCAFI